MAMLQHFLSKTLASNNVTEQAPKGILAIRTIAMPADTNPSGDIFGGWLVSQMDLAGAYVAKDHVNERLVTVAIDKLEFINPVHVGDFICCYTDIIKLGTTSITINVESWAIGTDKQRRIVTEGQFIYVSVDKDGRPTPLIDR